MPYEVMLTHAGWQNSKSETNFFSGVLSSLEANENDSDICHVIRYSTF
jgi:hypothetical protein